MRTRATAHPRNWDHCQPASFYSGPEDTLSPSLLLGSIYSNWKLEVKLEVSRTESSRAYRWEVGQITSLAAGTSVGVQLVTVGGAHREGRPYSDAGRGARCKNGVGPRSIAGPTLLRNISCHVSGQFDSPVEPI